VGNQYAGGEYRKLIKKAKLTQSMSRKGQCLDNAPMESFFASLKKELVHRQRFKTRAEWPQSSGTLRFFTIARGVTPRSDIKRRNRRSTI
jgi:transposase InsO family protein